MLDYFQSVALRHNTKKTYKAHSRTFFNLCKDLDIDPLEQLSEKQLALVVSTYSDTHKVTTVPGFISAVEYLSEQLGHGPLPRGALFNRVNAGIKNHFGNLNYSIPKQGFTLDDLCSFYSHIDHDSFAGARDWCACVFAFFGLLRINEYMNAGLLQQHVKLHSKGISLTVPFSKTSLIPTLVDISKRDDLLCPVRAFTQYSSFLSGIAHYVNNPTAPLFLNQLSNNTVTPMTDAEFISDLRDLIRCALPDKDPTEYAGHSFRRGGATAMKLAGVSDSTIQRHGRWKSDAFLRYFDNQNDRNIRLLASSSILPIPTAKSLP